MSNDHFRQNDDLPVSNSVEEWLSQQAAEEDISQEQLFGRLVSSYWTLNEMEELLGGATDGDRSIGRPSSENPVESDSEAHERLMELEETVETEVEHRQSLDMLVETTADRLTTVEETVEELSAEVEGLDESLNRKHESLTEQTDELAEELEQERETRASEQQMLAGEQERISTRLDSEFDNLETILTYLVSRTDELEADVSDVDSRQEEALMRLRWERDALNSIKRDAADANVQSGECESCGETIDLGLLSQPYCPACENTLTGVTEERKWLLFSNIVVTTKDQSQEQSAQDSGQPSPEAGHPGSGEKVAQSRRHSEARGTDRRAGGDTERPERTRQDSTPKPEGFDLTTDRAPAESGESDSADAGDMEWAGSGFENPTLSEESPDTVSDRHGRPDESTPFTSGQNGDRAGAEAADNQDGPGGADVGDRSADDSDTTESPFGDLDDLTDAE
jgi:hypothetical protein